MYIQFPGVLPVFSDPAIVLSIFMLWFIFEIACDLFEWKPFIVYLHIHVLSLETQLSRREGLDLINRFNIATF